jgi:hypothetical protein
MAFAAAFALVLLPACSIPRLHIEHLDDIPDGRIAEIDALPETQAEMLPTKVYADLGMVEGVSCKRSSREVASWEDAIRRAKFRAMQKGANSIANLSCEQPKGGSFISRLTAAVNAECMESIRCTASAVRK